MTLAWISERLSMGAASHLACLLHRHTKEKQDSGNTLF